jgi:hypothetical protein
MKRKRSKVTYGELDKVLKGLGFTCRPSDNNPPGRIYEHKRGAIVGLPTYPDKEKVYEYHMFTVRSELETFGIADADAFDAKFQKAS